MSLELASFSMPVGTIGLIILAVSLVAAFVVSYLDKARKSSNSDSKSKAVGAAPISTKNEDSVDTRQHCTILFGTQTGTAERFAKSLKSQLESKYGGSTRFDVIDVENYNAEEQLAKEKLVFFMMATYGDGEPTDNAADFYNWLITKSENYEDAPLCKDVSFGVFGLGNKQYEHFCAVGKKIHKAMQELGATPIVRLGTGDDDDDIDEDFDAWSADLFAALATSPLLKAGSTVATSASVPAYEIEKILDAPTNSVDVLTNGAGLNHTSPHLATITTVKELHTAASDRSCVHVEIDISRSQATYEAGDHIAVFAENSPEIVSDAAKALGFDLNQCFRMKQPSGGNGLTEPPTGVLSVRGALSRYADLLSAPSKAALSALSVFATDKAQAARLAELASIEGRDAYHSYIISAKRSLLEVLQDFPSVKPSLGAFFGSIAPRLQPRYYSISSSPAAHPRSVHITVAVVRETMPTGRVHKGVASSWLAAVRPGAQIPVFLRHSTFKLPKDPSTPVIMVGPGTGFAPFRGFIQERAALVSKGTKLGPGVLYFGCRRQDQDYIYQEELESSVASGALSELNVAFSRQSSVKDYVQHHMARQGDSIWALLNSGGNSGYVYVCGDAKNMAKDVNQTLIDIATKANGGNAAAGEAFVRNLADSGQYLKDVW